MVPEREVARRFHRHPEYHTAPRNPLVVLANDLDKVSNAGGIVRVAEAFMIERVIFDRLEPDNCGAMGAERWQPVEWGADAKGTIDRYKSLGYMVVALEQQANATPITTFRFPERVLLVVGSEMFGVANEIAEVADSQVYIPQAGLVKSLNVATAASIAMYEYSRQHWMSDFVQPDRHLESSVSSVRILGGPVSLIGERD